MTSAPGWGQNAAWTLAVDFGTVFTVAAVSRGDEAQVVDLEGDGSMRLHSGILLEATGSLSVGTVARHEAEFTPERYEPTPKRCIGEAMILLGDRTIPVTDAIAAVLVKVITEARRLAGGSMPSATFVTHPAVWAATRTRVLLDAAHAAGMADPRLVPEPVAAAIHIGAATAAVGSHVAIYDFGGGTFDAAVLRRTEFGYVVAGPPGGRDPLGGEDIDQALINYLGTGELGAVPEWQLLLNPPDLRWRRAAGELRDNVREAKEGLSTTLSWQLWVPGLERDVQVTRSEFEQVVRADVEATVDILGQTITAAGLKASQLEGIYLVGGSSRIPLIAQTIWERLELRPHTYDDPKAVVALGAAERIPAAARTVATPDVRPASAAMPAPGAPALPPGATVPAGARVPAPPAAPPRAAVPPSPAWRRGGRPGSAPGLDGAAPRAAGSGVSLRTALTIVAGAVALAAALVIVIVATRGDQGGSSSSTSTGSTTSSSASSSTAPPAATPLTTAQLGSVMPSASDIGPAFSAVAVQVSLSNLQLCGRAPDVTAVSAESATAYSDGTNAVIVDAAQFQAGRAAAYLTAQPEALQSCAGTWATTDSAGARVQATASQVDGPQIGDQTLRFSVQLTGSGASSFQNAALVRVGDAVLLVVIQSPGGNGAEADTIAAAATAKLRRAGG